MRTSARHCRPRRAPADCCRRKRSETYANETSRDTFFFLLRHKKLVFERFNEIYSTRRRSLRRAGGGSGDRAAGARDARVTVYRRGKPCIFHIIERFRISYLRRRKKSNLV
ncbi:hypothetical protein EVAR_18318_1 [Eumeta japonica]|uniref:Uncharacterized protein n=1 Tax=Eumeta variegata TaxID=151549 RepID=A0A4C1V8V3_EUMVA|nr:hypothetical protein EVAR_18318_1 [Eumeta japonica]